MTAEKWDAARFGELNLENVRLRHQPEKDYKTSWNKYPPGANFGGWSLAARFYAVSGICAIEIADAFDNLSSREFIDLPEGSYQFRVAGDSAVEIIKVWKLPKL